MFFTRKQYPRETAVEGLMREYQTEDQSAGKISSKKKERQEAKKTKKDSWVQDLQGDTDWGARNVERFTPTEALKSMGLWGRRIDPWWLNAWSCAGHTRKSTAWAAQSAAPSKALGWRSLHSRWRRRNLYRWPNRSPESASQDIKHYVNKGKTLLKEYQVAGSEGSPIVLPGSRWNWASTPRCFGWCCWTPAERPRSWWRTGSGKSTLRARRCSASRWKWQSYR